MRLVQPLILAILLAGGAAAADRPVDFNRDIRPILSSRCILCHGPDEEARPTDLRLDQEESAKGDLGGYRAVVPGRP